MRPGTCRHECRPTLNAGISLPAESVIVCHDAAVHCVARLYPRRSRHAPNAHPGDQQRQFLAEVPRVRHARRAGDCRGQDRAYRRGRSRARRSPCRARAGTGRHRGPGRHCRGGPPRGARRRAVPGARAHGYEGPRPARPARCAGAAAQPGQPARHRARHGTAARASARGGVRHRVPPQPAAGRASLRGAGRMARTRRAPLRLPRHLAPLREPRGGTDARQDGGRNQPDQPAPGQWLQRQRPCAAGSRSTPRWA